MLGNGTEIGDQLANSTYYNGLSFQLRFRENNLKDPYNQVYRYPVLGLGWYSSTFQTAEIGKPNALCFFFDIPFSFENNRKFTWIYTGAFGLSYNFNPYDEVRNPSNIFIGSYKNCYVHIGFVGKYHFSTHWAASAAVGFTHFSNGSFKQPNYGINLLPFTVGVNYTPKGSDIFTWYRT